MAALDRIDCNALYDTIILCVNSGPTIGMLDMSGFERFPINGFEQLCINAANERFHQCFNKTIFLMELEDYRKEGVDATKVKFRDNQPVIDLLFQVI